MARRLQWQAALSKKLKNARRSANAPSPRTRRGFVVVALFISLTCFLSGWASPPNSTGSKLSILADGVASYYGKEHHGKKTANGEIFDMNKLTAAHRSLPFGSRVKVTNLSNQRSVIVRINDRGPYYQGRIIDLSLAAAERLEMVKSGITKVKLEVLDAKRSASN
jgi:rare lipoprotein A